VRVAVTFPDSDTPISRGVIAHAQSTGRPVESACARLDPRFRDLGSVHRNQVEAVLCVPILMPDLDGAVYVDRAVIPVAFSSSAFDVVKWFGHQFAEVADRIIPSEARSLHHQTRRFQQQRVREALLRSNWNVASAARDLNITRNFVYSISPEARRRKK
jgi:GAF domain-containing protein